LKSYVIVYITAKDRDEAKRIGKALLGEKLVVCVNIFPQIESMYWWKGDIKHHNEFVIIAKTKEELIDDVISTVKKNHSYTTPCVVAVSIKDGNTDYLKWIDETLSKV